MPVIYRFGEGLSGCKRPSALTLEFDGQRPFKDINDQRERALVSSRLSSWCDLGEDNSELVSQGRELDRLPDDLYSTSEGGLSS